MTDTERAQLRDIAHDLLDLLAEDPADVDVADVELLWDVLVRIIRVANAPDS